MKRWIHGLGVVPCLFVPALAVSARDCHAQIRVHVEDRTSGLPLPEAAVRVISADSSVIAVGLTGAHGQVILPDSTQAATWVRAEALGYEASTVAVLGNGSVKIRLTAVPIDLDSLQVIVSGEQRSGRSQFAERLSTARGIFLDPVDVALKIRHRVTDVFYDIPGIRRSFTTSDGEPRLIPSMGRGCLNFRLNNVPVRGRAGQTTWSTWPLSSVFPSDVMAVEIYRYFGEVPLELRHDAAIGGGPCGLVIIWTKVGW